MAAETGFLIEDKIYELPPLDSLTTDEEEVMYQRCGIVQEDFAAQDGETDEEYEQRTAGLMRRPGFMAALMQIAYQRGNPTVKPDQVRLVIGKTKRVEALSTLASDEQEEEPEVPLGSTSAPSGSSGNGSLESDNLTPLSPVSSGSDATSDSEEVAGEAANTGISRSGTSSISGQEISAA